ncbi:hypothetical protein F5Y00DRAFT_269175 [Daldinia vernicosa]|uniref:uncharacterized protein n=1 Tax=Daldinia vernicosa TaxID=114800 RepID=UPI002008DC6D|nr:uncharacterized protein F5Y00DRAFT_269175 [Daldinia vernicosa]KAI0853787.1 hypothetical protein F5Y00DRAFT_269175 [Daldinia vernicosa]
MSTGGTGGNPIWGRNHGATAAQQNVDPSDDPDPKGTAAGYVPDQNQGKSLLGTLKEALKPGDAKRQQHQGPGFHGDFTHDGRHGGVEETMEPGHRDYDESQEAPQTHRNGRSDGGGVLESVMPGYKGHSNKERGGIFSAVKSAGDNTPHLPGPLKKAVGGGDPGSVGQSGQSMQNSGGNDSRSESTGGRTDKHSRFDKFPATGNYLGPEPGSDSTTKASAFDTQGSIGHQFTSEGAIGGTANKIGGPFSKEGVIGRQFTDKGSVGGTVQDTVGRGNETRKGV